MLLITNYVDFEKSVEAILAISANTPWEVCHKRAALCALDVNW